MAQDKLAPVHHGEATPEHFLTPPGRTHTPLARATRAPRPRVNEIVQGKRRITPDTALRLSRYFGVSPQFWLGLQMDYDLDVALDELASRIENEVTPRRFAASYRGFVKGIDTTIERDEDRY